MKHVLESTLGKDKCNIVYFDDENMKVFSVDFKINISKIK